MIVLQVYVSSDCWSCAESRRIVADVVPNFPDVVLELLEMNGRALPEPIFAVPTYVLNGRVISLGNPTRQELSNILQAALQTIPR
jgi:hypothetical protein